MNRLALLVALGLLCACPINPGVEMWESNDRGAPRSCLPFAADGGVGSGVVTGATSFSATGSHHFAYSNTGLRFLQLQLDEGGTTCHLAPQAEANRASGLRLLVVTLAAPADAGWGGTYEVSGISLDGGRTGTSSLGTACRPFLGLLGDCSPNPTLLGTVTIESIAACGVTGRFQLVDPMTDAGSSGRFDSVYCRGFD